jgi:large subunit ribosomal protein L25
MENTMSQISILAAEVRDRAGKGAARAARRSGRIPAVIYGNRLEPLLISVDPKSVGRELHRPGFFTRLYDVDIGGQKHRVLPRDVQLDPVTDRPLHLDFLRVSEDSTIHVAVPVQFINQDKSPGLRRGGVLNVVRHEIEMVVRASAIPDHVTVDLAGTDIGTSIHISMIVIPEGAKLTITDRDFTVATVAAPTVEKVAETVVEAAPVAAAATGSSMAAPGQAPAKGGPAPAKGAAPAKPGGKG